MSVIQCPMSTAVQPCQENSAGLGAGLGRLGPTRDKAAGDIPAPRVSPGPAGRQRADATVRRFPRLLAALSAPGLPPPAVVVYSPPGSLSPAHKLSTWTQHNSDRETQLPRLSLQNEADTISVF